MEHVRLIGLTAALSFLIWIVADYSLSETAELQLLLEPYPAASDVHVDVPDHVQPTCEAVVTGKRAVVAMLKSRPQPLVVRVPVGSRTPGEHELVIKEALAAVEGELADVIVQDVSPRTLTLRVDRDKTVTMPVHVRPGTLEYDGPIVVDPAEVSVTMLELEYEQVPPSERRVIIDADEHLRTAPRGELRSVPVPLKGVVWGFSVQLDPEFVTLRYRLAEQLQEWPISAVPISFVASLDIFNQYQVVTREAGAVLTQPITIKGRAEVVDRIRTDVLRVSGVITITSADKGDPDRYILKKPQFNLPEGVELISEPEPIEFRLVQIDKEPVLP